MLAYPVIDADFDRGSYKEWGDGPGLTRLQMEWFWDNYVDAADRRNPYVSPLYAETFAGVAPALVITAEADPLQDEGEAYAQRLHDDGIPVVHTMYPGMHHGFLNLTQLFQRPRKLSTRSWHPALFIRHRLTYQQGEGKCAPRPLPPSFPVFAALQ